MGNHHSTVHTSVTSPHGLPSLSSSSHTSSIPSSSSSFTSFDPQRSEKTTTYRRTTLTDIYISSASCVLSYLTATDCLALYLIRKDKTVNILKNDTFQRSSTVFPVTEFLSVLPSTLPSISVPNSVISASFFEYIHSLIVPTIEQRVKDSLDLRNVSLNSSSLSLPFVGTSIDIFPRNFFYKRETPITSWFELMIDTEEWYRMFNNTLYKINRKIDKNSGNDSSNSRNNVILSPISTVYSSAVPTTIATKNEPLPLGDRSISTTMDRSHGSSTSLTSTTPSSAQNSVTSSLSLSINLHNAINLGSSITMSETEECTGTNTAENFVSTFVPVPNLFRILGNLVLRERIYYRRYYPFYSIFYIGALVQENTLDPNDNNDNSSLQRRRKNGTFNNNNVNNNNHNPGPLSNGPNASSSSSSSSTTNPDSWALVRLRLVDWIRNLCTVHGLPRNISYDAITVADRCIGNTKGPLDCLQIQLLYLVSLCTVVSRHGYGTKIINRFKKCTNAYTDADYRSMETYIESNLVRRSTLSNSHHGSTNTAVTSGTKTKRKDSTKLFSSSPRASSTPPSPFTKSTSTDAAIPFTFEHEPTSLELAIDEITFTSIPAITETILSLLSSEWQQPVLVHVDHLVWIAQREYGIARWSNIAIGVAIAYLALRVANKWDGSELISNTSTYWLQIIFDTLHIDFVSIRDISIFLIHYAGQNSIYSKLSFNFPYKLGKLPILLHVPGNEIESLMEENMEIYFRKLRQRHQQSSSHSTIDTPGTETIIDTSSSSLLSLTDFPGPNISLLAYNFALQATLPGSYVPQTGLPDTLLYPILRYHIDVAKEPPVFVHHGMDGTNIADEGENQNHCSTNNATIVTDTDTMNIQDIDVAMDSASLQLQRLLLYEQLETIIQPSITKTAITSTAVPCVSSSSAQRIDHRGLYTPIVLELDDTNNNSDNNDFTEPSRSKKNSNPAPMMGPTTTTTTTAPTSSSRPPRQSTLTRKRSASAVLISSSGDDYECELRYDHSTKNHNSSTVTMMKENICNHHHTTIPSPNSTPPPPPARTRAVTSIDNQNTPLFIHSHSHHHIHPTESLPSPTVSPTIMMNNNSLLPSFLAKPMIPFQRLRPFHSTDETIVSVPSKMNTIDTLEGNLNNHFDIHTIRRNNTNNTTTTTRSELSSRSIRQRIELDILDINPSTPYPSLVSTDPHHPHARIDHASLPVVGNSNSKDSREISLGI